jgi:hypothetical protein
MAKAHIITADGSTVNLEGSPSEISAMLKELKLKPQSSLANAKSASRDAGKHGRVRTTVGDLLDELIGDQFFKKPKGLGAVKDQLANLGHHYPLSSLSGPLMGYAKKRKLRRYKESGKFVYSQ